MPDADLDLEVELRAAADRVLAGAPVRSSGRLTIIDLAAEAGVKRWILTHKRPDLMRAFRNEFRAAGHQSKPVQAAHDRIEQLQEDLQRVRAENRELAAKVVTYATVINELAEEVENLTEQRDQAIRDRDAVLTKVTALPTRSTSASART